MRYIDNNEKEEYVLATSVSLVLFFFVLTFFNIAVSMEGHSLGLAYFSLISSFFGALIVTAVANDSYILAGKFCHLRIFLYSFTIASLPVTCSIIIDQYTFLSAGMRLLILGMILLVLTEIFFWLGPKQKVKEDKLIRTTAFDKFSSFVAAFVIVSLAILLVTPGLWLFTSGFIVKALAAIGIFITWASKVLAIGIIIAIAVYIWLSINSTKYEVVKSKKKRGRGRPKKKK